MRRHVPTAQARTWTLVPSPQALCTQHPGDRFSVQGQSGQERGASASTALTAPHTPGSPGLAFPSSLGPGEAGGQGPPGAEPGQPQQEGGLTRVRLPPRKEPCVAGKAGASGPPASPWPDGWRRLERIYFFHNPFPKLAFLCIAATTGSVRRAGFHLSAVGVCFPWRKRKRRGSQQHGPALSELHTSLRGREGRVRLSPLPWLGGR